MFVCLKMFVLLRSIKKRTEGREAEISLFTNTILYVKIG